MSLTLLCGTSGINGGTIDCPIVPGVGKYLVAWGGTLTKAQLAQGYATCKAALIANSKLSKLNSSKLMVFPIISELTPKNIANTEAKLADGYSQITLEGVPAYDFKLRTDMYLSSQLRKLNGKIIKYAIVDAKNQFLCTVNSNGDMTGRTGTIFTSGIDVHGYSNVDGECVVSLTATNAYETFDYPACIQLDAAPPAIFKYLKDIILYMPVAPTVNAGSAGTPANASVTISSGGSAGDTIDVKNPAAVSITGGPVTRTSAESTPALLATKINTAINANTLTNGGFTSTVAGAVVTILSPAANAATFNTLSPTTVLTGTITTTILSFAGGVSAVLGTTVLHMSGQINSPNPNIILDFYSDYSGSALGTTAALWYIQNLTTKVSAAPANVAPNAAGYFDVTTGPLTSGVQYQIGLATPDVLDTNLVYQIEGNSFVYTAP